MNLIDLVEQGRHKVDTDLRRLISLYGEDNISNVVLDLFTMRQCSYRGFNRLNVDEVRGVLYEEDGAFRSRKMKGQPLRGEHNLEEEIIGLARWRCLYGGGTAAEKDEGGMQQRQQKAKRHLKNPFGLRYVFAPEELILT